mmetsp:Transcript_21182/g.27358  ORF Transcript_21182/g.27358 Transcript_21182/m.27358 type:complete len:245 (-) Transcript_21182:268-1002(-)|eukprot:CAMPEP_0198148594 /NCGR_PEP_ID=MMETSP1443-20131203/42213_1 /TAXON_ID=186043 /ORGANISM="Entomoneis sp., Strain CCMP2396" /LENGTH=244 /DNA_ID=CAMNT_0043813315 /DNA_START=160 /DNA_END=894 /DNA_ORIENTATION=+
MKTSLSFALGIFAALQLPLSAAFGTALWQRREGSVISSKRFMSTEAKETSDLADPTFRVEKYGSNNIGRYLVDLHDSKATFNFCGGMMFQLVLSETLRKSLLDKAGGEQQQQPVVLHDATKMRMHQIPNYDESANADDIHVFHGREIRQVPTAAGGMNFVLQLSSATKEDAEGWTDAERKGYDGWGHDSGRVWRKGDRLEQEGFTSFRKQFGPDAFALHHRFYLHLDRSNRMWLSAEDGCEGVL